jgi:zinc protease
MKNNMLPVQEFETLGGRLFVAPTGAHDLVAVEGSILGGPNMLPVESDVLPMLAAALLDAGTATKNKQDIRNALAARGITLGFASLGDRTFFSGRCFPEDLSMLLATISECLTGAIFPESEIKNIKALSLGALAEEKSDTRAQAERALAAVLYDPTHVNYVRPIQDEEKSITAARRHDLMRFRSTLGRGGLIIAITGDIVVAEARKAVEKAFAKLGLGIAIAPVKHPNKKTPTANKKLITIADKATVDVLLGLSLPITTNHELYHPMKVLVDMLGGGFTSHLMQTIRERDGLTYGVYARLAGLDSNTDGYLKIWASFAPSHYLTSVEKLRQELEIFFAKGITPAALLQTQERIAGSYLVSLATTQSMATALHIIGTHGWDLSYLTEYPNLIRQVSLADLKKAAELIPLTKLSLAAAGTI